MDLFWPFSIHASDTLRGNSCWQRHVERITLIGGWSAILFKRDTSIDPIFGPLITTAKCALIRFKTIPKYSRTERGVHVSVVRARIKSQFIGTQIFDFVFISVAFCCGKSSEIRVLFVVDMSNRTNVSSLSTPYLL